MGKPIPDAVQDERTKSAGGKGLKLSRGPDPRSFNRASAGITAGARGILGLTDGCISVELDIASSHGLGGENEVRLRMAAMSVIGSFQQAWPKRSESPY